MSEKPVNLNRFRKKKARAEKKVRADENAVLYGMPKTARVLAQKEAARSKSELNGKKRTTE